MRLGCSRSSPLRQTPAGAVSHPTLSISTFTRRRLCDDQAMARDRWGLRRTFRTPAGRSAVSWRWEVGLPLFLLGFLTALLAGGVNLLFLVAAVVAGIGAALFFSGML